MRGGRLGEDGGGYGRAARDCDFSGEGGITENLRGGVEVTDGVGGDDHNRPLGISMCWRLVVMR